MSTNPPEGGCEPADLSELTATDALLDRLGARQACDDDLLDPTVSFLTGLLVEIDEHCEPDLGLARLVEVLAGRPLYLSGAQEADDMVGEIGLELSARPGDTEGDNESDRSGSSVIDLTEVIGAGAGAGPAFEPELPETVPDLPVAAARTAETSPEPTTLIPLQGGRRGRWAPALSQLSLPAVAAAALLFMVLLGGGVSAVVTGDPMAPVNGVTRAVAQLPGVGNPQGDLDRVRAEITAASQALSRHDTPLASQHLQAARRGLQNVPTAQKSQLQSMIATVQTQLSGQPTGSGSVTPTPPAGIASTTTPATAQPSPSVVATTPGAEPDPTVTSSEEPAPSTDPTTSPPAEQTPASADPTTAASDSDS